MKIIKKSFNMDGDMAQAIDEYIQDNPGANFTLVMNQALKQWMKSGGKIELQRRAATEADIDRFFAENKGLMKKLAK